MTASHVTTAQRLLAKVVAARSFDLDEIARELVVPRAAFEAYVGGTLPIPLDRQLCLALFVIEKMPALARLGHQLRGQVAAAMAYDGRATETHKAPPPSRTW